MVMGGGGGDRTGQMIVEVERGKCMGGEEKGRVRCSVVSPLPVTA